MKGIAPHDDMVFQRGAFEILQVGRQVPWDLVVFPDYILVSNGNNSGNEHKQR